MALKDTIDDLRTAFNMAPPNLTRSLDEFVASIEREGIRNVVAYPHVAPDSYLWGMFHRMRAPENYSRWRHLTVYQAFSRPGRTIALREHYGRWGDDADYEDPFEARRDLARLKHYVTMQTRLDEIRRAVPGIVTWIHGPTGTVDDLNAYKLKVLAAEGVPSFSVVAFK